MPTPRNIATAMAAPIAMPAITPSLKPFAEDTADDVDVAAAVDASVAAPAPITPVCEATEVSVLVDWLLVTEDSVADEEVVDGDEEVTLAAASASDFLTTVNAGL